MSRAAASPRPSARRPVRGARKNAQLALGLPAPKPRRARGRPRGRSDHYVPHLPRARVSRHNGVHVTLRLLDGLPSLRRPTLTDLLRRVFGAECRRKGFRLVHFAIRSNHLHLVCEADDTVALSRGVQRLASRVARRLNERLGRSGRAFRDRFHGVVIATPRQMRNVLRYVLLNAHKDAARRGRALSSVDHWSSAFYFDGFANVGPVPPAPPPKPGERIVEPQAPPVTAPRSWLIRTGWRRYGLIDTAEYAPHSAPGG
jgi:REP element-mobilizing transposase RayT